MAIELSEAIRSRSTIDSLYPEVRFNYHATGTADDQELLTYLRANIPGDYEGLFLRSISYDPENVDEVSSTGLWRVEAVYARPELIGIDTTLESTEEFDTSGVDQRIFQSIATVGAYTAAGDAPNLKGAIGFDGRKVNGVDIIVPAYKFSLSYPFLDSSITTGYKGLLFGCTGKVNDASFKGFNTGEVLLLGVQGQRRGIGVWTLRFDFVASPNLSDIPIGDINVDDKKGWEYLWVLYEDSEDEFTLVQTPKAAYVEQVYYYADFASLGIGT